MQLGRAWESRWDADSGRIFCSRQAKTIQPRIWEKQPPPYEAHALAQSHGCKEPKVIVILAQKPAAFPLKKIWLPECTKGASFYLSEGFLLFFFLLCINLNNKF